MMKKTEIYTYSRIELNQNHVIVNEKTNNDIKYITENTIGNIYLPNSKIKVGKISYINNLVRDNEVSFNTSLGTIITQEGSLVFNFNYILKFKDSRPEQDKVLITKPNFISGKYLNYKDLTITVQILENSGDRIIAIEYFE